eukprot:7206744-Pyramimonas_sp.AAC.1
MHYRSPGRPGTRAPARPCPRTNNSGTRRRRAGPWPASALFTLEARINPFLDCGRAAARCEPGELLLQGLHGALLELAVRRVAGTLACRSSLGSALGQLALALLAKQEQAAGLRACRGGPGVGRARPGGLAGAL